jgi:hypothetical protein
MIACGGAPNVPAKFTRRAAVQGADAKASKIGAKDTARVAATRASEPGVVCIRRVPLGCVELADEIFVL